MKKYSIIFSLSVCLSVFMVSSSAFISCSGSGKDDKDGKKDSAVAVASKPLPGSPIKYDSSKRYIYLTWDDAPQPPGTQICKNIFHSEGIKATFFVVGMNQFGRLRANIIDTLRNSYPEFVIANHSYSHGFKNNYKKFYAQPDSAVQDFLRNEAELKVPVKIIRLPGNNSWVGTGEVKGPKSTLPVCRRLRRGSIRGDTPPRRNTNISAACGDWPSSACSTPTKCASPTCQPSELNVASVTSVVRPPAEHGPWTRRSCSPIWISAVTCRAVGE